jgi:hypothetical protein
MISSAARFGGSLCTVLATILDQLTHRIGNGFDALERE